MKTKTREEERRDSALLIILILLLGFICIILASGWAIRFAPSWRLNTNMGSKLNPNSDFITSQPVSFVEPLDPAILTNPAWINVFLTPGASFPTRTPSPAIATSVSPKTSTPVPTLIVPATNTLIVNPTNTLIYFPPPATATPKPVASSIPILTSTVSNTPLPPADLQITNNDGVATYNPGGALTYIITVTNSGPSAIFGAVITDNIPAQVTTWSWACSSQTGGATGCDALINSNTNFSDTVNLPNGASIIYTVTAKTSAGATGSIINMASINGPAGYSDPTLGNNSATDIDSVQFSADLQITKTDGVNSYIPGASVTYSIVVTNSGPSNTINATVTDIFSAQIASANWTCVATGSATCTTNGSGNINDAVNIPVGGSLTYTVTANIAPSATGNLVNIANIVAPAGYTDLIPGNNSATDTDAQFIPPSVDLQIAKNDGVTTYSAGSILTYAITVTNNGPNAVLGALIADNIPPQIAAWDWVCTSQTGGATGCAGVVGSSTNFTNTVNMPNGASIVYTVTAQISGTASGSLVNTATVNVPIGYIDPTPANNSAMDTDLPAVDLQITKTDGVATYTPGGATLTYTIVVTNNSTFTVNGVGVTDILPFQIATANWTCAPTLGATCTLSGAGNINDSVNLPPSATVSYIMTASTSPNAVGTLNNIASVTTPGGFSEVAPGNNSATDSDTSTTINPNIGPPDGNWITPPPGTSITLVFSPAIIANGHAGPDFVYYERLATPTTIALDWVKIEISKDGITWYPVFYWGDGTPDTNSNVDINVIGGTEADNRSIPTASLYNSTGITVDIDGIVPLGSYPWMRITSPVGGANGTDVDAIQPLP